MNNTISNIEQIWAKQKYNVLAKSQNIYLEIRELLKRKNQDISERFLQLIDNALQLPEHKPSQKNAYQHVYGYFKNKVSFEEKMSFQTLLKQFSANIIQDKEMRLFLFQLAKKYESKYLLESYFFNGV